MKIIKKPLTPVLHCYYYYHIIIITIIITTQPIIKEEPGSHLLSTNLIEK